MGQGLAARAAEIVRSSTAQLLQNLGGLLPGLAAAALVLLASWGLATLARWVASASARYVENPTQRNLMRQVSYYVVWAVGGIVALDVVGIDARSLVTGLGLGSVALGFALKDILSNLVSGLMILLSRTFEIGDQIIVGETEGTVERIEVRVTHIRTYDGKLVLVPNGDVFMSRVTNNTASPLRRASVFVYLDYTEDLERAMSVILQAVSHLPGVALGPRAEHAPARPDAGTLPHRGQSVDRLEAHRLHEHRLGSADRDRDGAGQGRHRAAGSRRAEGAHGRDWPAAQPARSGTGVELLTAPGHTGADPGICLFGLPSRPRLRIRGVMDDHSGSGAHRLGLSPVRLLLFSVGYLLSVIVGERAYGSLAVPSPFWFPDSVLLCALLLTPRTGWIALLANAAGVRVIASAVPGTPFWFLLTTASVDLLKGVVAAWWLQRTLGRTIRLNTLHELVVFFGIAAAVVPMLSGLLVAPARIALGYRFWPSVSGWFMGDAVAHVVVTPALLYWCMGGHKGLRGRVREAVLVMAGLLAIHYLVHDQMITSSPLVLYTPVPFLIWAAVRLHPSARPT